MILPTRLICLLVLAAAMAAAGCDKAQSVLNDARQRADQFGAAPSDSATTSVDPEAETDDLEGALPPLPSDLTGPNSQPSGTPAVVDDAAVIAEWNATKSHERTDAAISKLLRASPESLQGITSFDFKSAGPDLTAAGFRLLKDFPLVKSIDCTTHPMDAEQLAAICELTQLENLVLRATNLNDSMLTPLRKVATLRTLNISNNAGVSDAGLKAIHNLVELQSLDMESTRVAGACLLKAHFLGGLKRLNADGAPFSEGFAALKSAPQLEFLGASNTNASDQHLKFLGGYAKLREIHLHGNGGVSDIGFSVLKGNPNFELIDIRATSVSGASLKFLLTAKKLRLLRTEGSKVDGLTLMALRKALPECTIQ